MKTARVLTCLKVRTATKAAQNAKADVARHNAWHADSLRKMFTTVEGPRPGQSATQINTEQFKIWKQYLALRKEAAIWNMVAVLAKHGDGQKALKHAPLCARSQYLKEAKKRLAHLEGWAQRNQEKARRLCEPLLKEYKQREESRLAKAGV
jgi:hypothetical protein